MALPLLIILGAILFASLRLCRVETKTEKDRIVDGVWSTVLLTLFLLYPIVSQQALFVFNCKQIGDDWYLASDLRQQCYTSEWTGYAYIGIAGIILYVIGIPLFCFMLLYYNVDVIQRLDADWKSG